MYAGIPSFKGFERLRKLCLVIRGCTEYSSGKLFGAPDFQDLVTLWALFWAWGGRGSLNPKPLGEGVRYVVSAFWIMGLGVNESGLVFIMFIGFRDCSRKV